MFRTAPEQYMKLMEDKPDEFVANECHITHKPSGVQVWVGNGTANYDFYRPIKGGFSYKEKMKFQKVFHTWRDNLIYMRLTTEEE